MKIERAQMDGEPCHTLAPAPAVCEMIRRPEYVTKQVAGAVLMGSDVGSHMSTLTLLFFCPQFFPTLLTTGASSSSPSPAVLVPLPPSFVSFYSCPSSISELFNSCAEEWEGEGEVVPAVQRDRGENYDGEMIQAVDQQGRRGPQKLHN